MSHEQFGVRKKFLANDASLTIVYLTLIKTRSKR